MGELAMEELNCTTNREGIDMNSSEISIEELAEAKKEKANQMYALEKYKNALTIYSEVIELCPNVPRYYANRAACYMMLSQYRNALTDSKKCIELDPKFLKAYYRIIKCSLILGDLIEAQSTINKLSELDCSNNVAIATEQKQLEYIQRYLKDAEAAYEVKDYRKVVYCMDRCCDVSVLCTRFKLLKAECLVYLGRYKEAQEIADGILHINVKNADAMYIRGMCSYYQDDSWKSFTFLQQVIKLAPDHSQTVNIYKKVKRLVKLKEDANTAFKLKRYQEAYNLFSEALTVDPENIITNAKLHFNKATAAAKLGNLNESITECTKAIELDENYLKAILRRAASYFELKAYEEAIRDFERACRLDNCRENRWLLLEAKIALKKSKRKDYYMILDIDKNACTDDIKKAYKKKAKVHHPDRHANAPEGVKKEQENKFKEIGEAYGILSDPKKRSRYDNDHDMDDMDHSTFSDANFHGMYANLFTPFGGSEQFTSFRFA